MMSTLHDIDQRFVVETRLVEMRRNAQLERQARQARRRERIGVRMQVGWILIAAGEALAR